MKNGENNEVPIRAINNKDYLFIDKTGVLTSLNMLIKLRFWYYYNFIINL